MGPLFGHTGPVVVTSVGKGGKVRRLVPGREPLFAGEGLEEGKGVCLVFLGMALIIYNAILELYCSQCKISATEELEL